ncbi:type II secretion system protein [Candidatus Saccharibacteria bacterium]|nr:type II secretion system protein [Candidatus Saccharibacteria bacterium]
MSIKELYGKKKDEGFTIIEVMIVLAIAGLIILIVFLAVPALQRNSRNTQRKNDASHLAGLVNEYVANHNGQLPTALGAGGLDLTNDNFSIMNKPSVFGNTFKACAGTAVCTNAATTLDDMVVLSNATCNSNAATFGGGTRAFTVTYQVEKSGGGGDPQCV